MNKTERFQGKKQMRRLPPMTALIAFEAAARLGGVRAASDELNVSQSAVSHQIAKLEDHLESLLFERRNRRLFLTDVGQDFLRKIEPALDSIANSAADASRHSKHETLTISSPPSFLAMWLMPRVSGFLKTHPNLNLRLVERMTQDPDDKRVDCSIEYRFQASKDLQTTRILPDEVVPLGSPELIVERGIRSVEDLQGIPLIETERRLISWKTILKSRRWLKKQRFISVGYSLHAFKAAELGIGIALGNRYNAQWYIDKNLLSVPFRFETGSLPPTPRYYISATVQKAALPKVNEFTSWIKNESLYL